jgi:Mlc titration factor MtfA (ptsG expression regulator)
MLASVVAALGFWTGSSLAKLAEVTAAVIKSATEELATFENLMSRRPSGQLVAREWRGDYSFVGSGEPTLFHPFKDRRRKALRAEPLPPEERAIIARNVPFVARLPEVDRAELEGLVQIFLAEKSFEGCGGLELTLEMKVTIAAQACILLLHRDTDLYPDVASILVYPGAYRAVSRTNLGGVMLEGEQARLGESWTRGVVILAWDHVTATTTHPLDGHGDAHNVVLHEFAHQLDSEDGAMNGTPDLGARARYRSWAEILGAELAELSREIHDDLATDIDPYGATNPAEFFAVVTEAFFETPRALKTRHPALYQELAGFYRQDPASLGSANANA